VASVRAALHCVNPEAAFCRVSGGTGTGLGVALDTVKSWVESCKFAGVTAQALRLVVAPAWDERCEVGDTALCGLLTVVLCCVVLCCVVRVCRQ
jgi:hypothetical protein